MSSSPDTTLDELLRKAGWLKGLARRLVADDSMAEDVVQETLLAALGRGLENLESPVAWARRVVVNLALRRGREESRRRRREVRAARPEVLHQPPDGLLERAELHRKIVEAVLALEEPYRATVLLRFFEEKSAGAIARLEGIPPATVRTRLARGLERLRRLLDREHGGDRAAWCVLLFPLIDWAAPKAAATMPAALGGKVLGAAAAAPASPWIALGGLVMTQKIVFTLGAIGIVSLTAGFGLGRSVWSVPGEAELQQLLLSRPEHVDLLGDRDRLAADLARSTAERTRIGREKEELADRLKALEAEKRSRDAREPAGRSAAEEGSPLLAFGRYADLDGLRNADWKELAGAVSARRALSADTRRRRREGQPFDPDISAQFAREDSKILRLAGAIAGKISTHALKNGEVTHPIVLTNLMGALLDGAGAPFSGRQLESIARIGGDFEASYDRLQASYGDATPALVKLADELELKRDAMRKVRGTLTADQTRAISMAEIEDSMEDPLSPISMVSPRWSFMRSMDEVQDSMRSQASGMYGMEPGVPPQLDQALDAWFRAVEPSLRPVSMTDLPRLDDLLALVRAQAEFLETAASLPGIGEQSAKEMLSDITPIVPGVMDGGKR